MKTQEITGGMVPPQALDLEESIIGSLLLEPDSINEIGDFIKPHVFYKDAHRIIAEIIFSMTAKNEAVDLMTVTAKLKDTGKLEKVGGAYAITMLTARISSSANIRYYAQIVYQKYIQREMIRLGSEIQKKSFEDITDPFDLVEYTQEQLSKLIGFDNTQVKHISESLTELMKTIERNQKNNGAITGIPTGIKEFDKFSNGLQRGDLIIIAGETSQGKTSLALNIGDNASKLGRRVMIYSYEMSDRQLAARLLSSRSNVSSKGIQYYKLSSDELENIQVGIGALEQSPIFLDELQSSRFDYLERSIRTMVAREKIEIVVIDYLQLIKPTDNRKDKVSAIADISNDLKNLAKQLNIPIILISQLSRDRTNPKPTLARLKGSGDIENSADIVWFVWQPTKYGHVDFDCAGNTFSAEGAAHHIIAKGRNIGTTEFVTSFNPETTTFCDFIPKQADYVPY